ncbi:MAG: IclR family transcriptional regulator [Nocardioides sp.]|nr:IclR family transcriptional regulator [Nocardioides sp.]
MDLDDNGSRKAADGGVASVKRALHLMEALLEGPVGATSLAAKLDVSKATAFRLARTLQGEGYVVQLEDSRYALGPRCLMLAAWAFGRIDIRRELRWAVEELHDRTEETAYLTVLAGRECVCIDSIPANKTSIVSDTSVGEVWPVNACATGVAFMAADTPFRELYLQQDLEAATSHTVTKPDEIRTLTNEVRSRGYAVNRSWWREGVFAVSSVVHDATGRPIAALGLMMPEIRHDGDDEALGSLMADVASRASQRLGYRGGSSPIALG